MSRTRRGIVAAAFAGVMVLVAALVAASTPDDQTASAGALKQDAGNDSGLNRGVNLDSWFQPIKNGDTGLDDWPFLNDPSNANSYVEADFDVLVRLGVDHVRIPVDFNSLADRGDGYRVDDRLIGALDQAVEWASTRGIKTVIAYHPGSALSFDDLKPGLAPIWTQVARHFEARGASEVYYEVLNEPKAPAGMSEAEATDAWGELQGEVVRAIRSADQRHPVIVGQVLDQDYLLFDKDADWREAKALPRYEDLYPDDGPFVYTFHFYSPIVFTHQGVGPRVTIQDVPFPYDSATMPRLSGLSETDQTEWDAYQRVGTAEALAKRLDEYIVQFANDRGVAVYCGEYGAFKDAPIASRLEWLRTVTALLEDRGIGRAHWSYSSGFGLFDSTSYGHRSDQLDAATVRAIGLSPLYEALLDCVNAAGADTPSVNSGTNELAVQAAASESTEAWACKLDTDKEATLDAITVSATVKSTLSWAEGSLDVRFYSADGAELDAKGAAGSRAAKQSAKMARVGDLHRYRIGSWFGQFDGLTVDETLLVPDGATEVRLYAIADSQEQTPRSGSLTLSELAVRPGVVLDPVGETFGSQSHSFEQTLFRDGQQPAWSFETVPAQAGTLKFEVKDIDGNQVATRTMAQPAAATGPISVHLDQLDLGYYTVAARFVGQDGEWGVWDSSFVVLPAQEPTPDQRFGVDAQLSFRTAPAEVSKRSAQLLAELGVGSARDRMNWSEAQPDCGTSWAEPGNGLAKAVAADLRTAGGIEDVQLFESSPECARPGSDYFKDAPTDYDAAYSYGRGYAQWALANQVRSVEVWNEPNASAFFRGYAYQYASLLKAFAAGVKSVQPGTGQDPVRVVMGGSADYPGQFMEEVYANNTAPFFDTRNQHFYRGNASNANTPADLVEFRSAEPSTMSNPWPAMSASVEKVEQEQGVADKPGWLTETGYAINRDATGSFAADELKQAEYLVKSYAQGFAAGYERVFEFAWQEVNEPVNGSFGIVRKDLSPRPATLALAVLTDHLAGAEVVATLTHGTSGRTVYFRQPSGAYVAVTWGGGANISADAAVRDVLGRPATPGEAAKTGAAPYLVSGIVQLPADAQTVKTPTGSPADTVPDAHLEVADVTVGGTAPPAPARGSTLNTEVAVAAGQEVTVSVRAWSDSRQDLSGSAAVTCQSGQGLALLSEASPKAVGEVFTCRYRATLEPGQASHATVALNGTEDVVRIALRGTPAAGSFVAAGHTFAPGEQVASPDGQTTFTWLANGKLELRQDGRETWRADTDGSVRLVLQTGGNLVAYNPDDAVRWATSSGDKSVAWLAVRDDGSLVLQSREGQVRWQLDPVTLAVQGAAAASTAGEASTVAVGATLVASGGHPSVKANPQTTESWQWYRDSAPIDGATAKAYTVTEEDLGAKISATAITQWPSHYTAYAGSAERTVTSPSGADGFQMGISAHLGHFDGWGVRASDGKAIQDIALDEFGADSLRDELFWSELGDTDANQNAARVGPALGRLDTVTAQGGKLLMILDYNHPQRVDASKDEGFPATPEQREAFANYALRLIERIGPENLAGVEVWNEWDIFMGWSGSPGAEQPVWNTPCPLEGDDLGGCPILYAKLVEALVNPASQGLSSQSLREAAPGVPIIVGATSSFDPQWTRPMLEYLRDNGVAVDGYSTHPYAAAAGNGCPVNWVTTPQDEGMAQCVKGARERVADWYGQDLPIYVTELGVTLGDPQVTPELQAERLVKSYVRTRAVGNVGGIWWYDLFQDYADGANDWESGYGLINRVGSRGEHQAGTTRPAGDAYGALAGFWRGCEDVQGAVTGTTYYRLTCANATPAGTRHVFLDASLGQLRAAQAAGGTLVDLLGVKGELSPGAPVTADWAGREVGVYGATADSFALRLSGQAYRGQTVTVVADSAATGLVGIDEYRWESKSGGGDWAQAAYAPADRTSPSYRIGGPDGTGWDDFQGTSGYGKDFRVQAIKDGEVLAEVRFRTTRSQAEGSAASAGVTSPVAGAIRISGDPTWAFDWAQPSQPGRLYVSVGAPCGGAGATGFGPFEANQHWPAYDAELYPQIEGGLHGFDLTFETGLYGTQPVYIYAVPVAWQPSDGCAGLATTLGSGNGTSVNLGAQPQVSEGLSAAAVTDEPDQPANYGLAGTEPAAWGAQTITVALRDSAGRPVTDAAAKLTVRASVYDPAAGAGLGFSDEGRFRCAAASAGEACPEGDYAVDVYSAVALTRQLEVDYVDDAVSFVVRNADGSGSRVLAARFVAAPASGVNSDLSVDPLGVVMAGQSFRATVQVRDAAGQPRGGDAVTFSLTGDECVAGLSAASGASGQSGQTGEGSQTGQSSQTGEGGPDGQTGEGGGGSPDGQGGPDATVLAGTAPGATTLTLTASILGSAQVDITGDAGVCELTATVGGQGVGASPVVLTWSATADGNATIRETVAGSAPFAVTLDEPLTWSFTADFTAGTGAGSGAGSAASLAASPAGSQAAPAASLVLRTTRDDGIVQSWKAVRGDPSDGGETGEEAVFTVTIPANALEPGYYDVEAGLPGAAQPWTGSVVVVDGPVDQDLTRRFGVDAGLSWSNPERTLAQIGQEAEWMQVIGLGSVRDRYSLAQVQSAGTAACAGDAVCIDNVDRVLNQDGGLDVVTVSSSGVARTSIRAPYNLDDAFAQGQAFATKMWPQVTTVEVANEPILPGFFSGYPFQYASALKAFSAGVKSVHPEMRVLTGSHTSMNMEGYQLSSWWGALYEQETLANNTAGSFDARNEHWYPRSPYYHNNGWFDVDKLAGAVPSVDVGTKRAVDQDAGIGDKPIWVTELADSFRPQSTGFDLDYWEAKQAALVAQSYAAALGSGAERVYAFYWQTLLEQCDSGVTSTSDCLAVWGLTRNAYSETYQDGRSQALSPRPALAATAALIRHVQDKQVVKVETSREVAGAPWIVGTTVYFSDQTAVTWDGSKTLADFGPGATAKNMYGRPVADLAPARTADVYYAPYLVSGVTSTGDGAVSVTVPGADAEPADAVSSGAEFRLGAGGLKINGEEPLQRKAYTNPATNQDDRDSTIGVKVGDVLTLDVQARAGAQNQNVAAATEFACQAGPGIEVDRAASGMVGSVYRCQFEVVGDVPARAQAYRDGVYSWTVPGFVSATATWQGLQDVVRVGLTHRAEGDFEVVGTPYIGQTMTVRTDLTGIAAYRWYDLDSTGSAALSSGGDYAGPNYLVTAADFNGTEGRRITVMAYDAAGQVLAQAWFQPTQVRLKGWIAANDLTSPAEGQVRINQAWAFDWQDLGATSRMVATVGATCANASAAQRYGFDSPYLANRAWPVAGEWYPGVVGGTYWFTGVDIAVAQRGEQPVYLYAVPSDWDGTCGQAVEFDGGGKAKGLYLGDPPWSARLVSPGWSAPADGSARLTVVTQVVDAAGAALTGVEVLFQVPEGVSVGATGGPTVISALTDGLGAARLMMTSQAAGSYEVRATIDGVAVVDGSPAVAVFTAEAPPSRGAAKADRRSQDSADPRVGVSVAGLWEPGFFDASWGPYMQADPWAMVKQHTPERQPELGWYNQLDPTVAEQQLAWMADYGIDYTSYLWLWNPDGESKSAASIDAYLAAPSQSELAFSLLWDFGESIEELTLEDWRGIVDGWLDRYLTRPEYLRIDGQPVVSLHGSADGLLDWASGQAEVLYPEAEYVRDGVTYSASPDARPKYFLVLQDLNAIADQAAVARGLAGMFLSSGFTTNTTAHWNMVSALARFDGDSPYNYHSAPTAAGEQEVYSHTFAELAGFYAQQWSAGIDAPFLDNADPADATQKRIVPITSGWDATPLTANGSPGIYADAAHNGSRSTPAQFEAHLGEARQFMAAHPGETLGLGRIYAWNEFMEGGMVEPTVQEGKAYLEAISRVFGRLETSTDRWEAPSGAGAMVVGVETDLRTWTVESSASWLTLGVASGSYDGEFAVVAAPNPTGQARQGVLTVTAGGIVREIEVSQAAGTALDVAASGFTVSGDPVFADGSATGAVTVALVGTDGAPWTGPVALVGSGGALSELSVGSFVHIGAGIHLARFTGTEVGDWPVAVTADGAALGVADGGNATARLVLGPVGFAAGQTQLVAPEGTAFADGSASLTLAAEVVDTSGRPMPGVSVLFNLPSGLTAGATGGEASVGVTSDPSGAARLTVTSLAAGVYWVTASVGGVAVVEGSPAAVEFTEVPAVPPVLDPARSSFTVSAGEVVADGEASGLVTVALVGSDGHPWAGDAALAGSGAAPSGLWVGPFSHLGAGIHMAPFRGTEVGDWAVSVTADGVALAVAQGGNGTARLVVGPPAFGPGLTRLVAPVGSARVDEPTGLTASVVVADSLGRPVPGVEVVFALPSGLAVGSTGGPATVSAWSGPDGVASVSVTASIPGVYPVTAMVGGVPVVEGSPALAEFTAVPDEPDQAPRAPAVDASNGRQVTGAVHEDDLDSAAGSALAVVAAATATGDELGRCQVAVDGSFGCPLPGLDHGTSVTVWLEDLAGNASPGVVVVVDAVAPAPVVVRPSDGRELVGTGEQPGDRVTVAAADARELCSAVIAEDLSWACALAPPAEVGAVVTVVVTDPAGNAAEIAWRIGVPQVTVDRASVSPGDTLTVTGVDFQPGETVTAVMWSDPVLVGQVTVGAEGSLRLSWVIPDSTEAGEHQVTLTGGLSGAWSAAFEVRGSGPTPTPTESATAPSADPSSPAPTGSPTASEPTTPDPTQSQTQGAPGGPAPTASSTGSTGATANPTASGGNGEDLPRTGPSLTGPLVALALGMILVGACGLVFSARRRRLNRGRFRG